MDKDYFALPNEILSRKDDLFSQNRYVAEYLRNFSIFLEKKKTNQNVDPDYNDLEGINGLTDILYQAEEGLVFNHETATKDEKISYSITSGKSYEKMRLLTKKPGIQNNVKLVIDDLSALVEDIRSKSIIPVQTLDFYINLINVFEKTVNPDAAWYDKGITVG